MKVWELKLYSCPSAGGFFFLVRLLEQAGKYKKLESSGFQTYFLPFDDHTTIIGWLAILKHQQAYR